MKKTLNLILALLLSVTLLVSPVLALDIPSPPDEGYVLDSANILSDSTEKEIINAGLALDQQCGAQIVVVTVDFLGGEDIEEYAYALFNDWGIGDSSENNGLLLLISAGDLKYWVTPGKGVEDVFSNYVLADIFYDHFDPYFDDGDFDSAVSTVYPMLAAVMEEYYNVSSNGDDYYYDDEYVYHYNEPYRANPLSSLFSIVFTIIIIAIIVIVIIAIFGSRGGGGDGGGGGGRRPRFFFFGLPLYGRRHWGGFHRPGGFHDHNHHHRGGGGGFGGFGGSHGGGFGGFGGGGSRGGGFGGFGGGGSRGGGFGRK